jgi:DNA-directed RNA polymerase sigma subunit (sigma70/sigma32)
MYSLYAQGSTLEEVGKLYGLTRERVRQLFKEADLPTRSRHEASGRNRKPGAAVVKKTGE